MRCVRGSAPAAGNEGDALMTAAAFGANAPASPKADDKLYFDLEPAIHDLADMAEIARYYAIEYLSGVSPDKTEEEGRAKSIALFAIAHVEKMARNLERVFDAGWNSARTERRASAPATIPVPGLRAASDGTRRCPQRNNDSRAP